MPSHASLRWGGGGRNPAVGAVARPVMLSPEQRRVLELLAGSPRGVTEAVLRVYGFPAEMLARLVLAEFATVVTETIKAGSGRNTRVERVRITIAGRRAIEG
jgi:hypothetical protein